MLTIWLKAVCANPHPEVNHLLFVVGKKPEFLREYGCSALLDIEMVSDAPRSIGHYHNLGAKVSSSEWIMKLDIDCVPHTNYFTELVEVLREAGPREWFNGGMYYLERFGAVSHLTPGKMPVSPEDYYRLSSSHVTLQIPAGTKRLWLGRLPTNLHA